MHIRLRFLMIALALSQICAQSIDVPYIESWKKGTRKIEGKIFEINLGRKSAYSKLAIKDSNGKVRYELLVSPDKQGKNTDGIHMWNVTLLKAEGVLSKLVNDDNVNLLKPANDPYQDSFGWEDLMGNFCPWCVNQYRSDGEACNPNEWFFKKRVIKVENFFVILQVKDYKIEEDKTSKLYPKLSSLTLKIEFTNSYTKQK